MDGISIIMFVVPLMLGVLFSILTLVPKGRDKPNTIFTGSLVTFFSSMLASICWFIFGLTWPAVATDVLFVSVAWLWFAVGIIFTVFTLVAAFKLVTAYFDNKKPKRLRMTESEED